MGWNQKRKLRALFQKPKIIVYVSRPRIFFESDPNFINCPVGPQKGKKGPKWG